MNAAADATRTVVHGDKTKPPPSSITQSLKREGIISYSRLASTVDARKWHHRITSEEASQTVVSCMHYTNFFWLFNASSSHLTITPRKISNAISDRPLVGYIISCVVKTQIKITGMNIYPHILDSFFYISAHVRFDFTYSQSNKTRSLPQGVDLGWM